ncbi:MAG: hypothetical protein RMK20_00950 [Verrucomicrobiales bacterium]|nr:hypothetical protein [Verrucomicrobiales bacterium]
MQNVELSDLTRALLGDIAPPELGPGPRPGVHSQARVEALVNERLGALPLPGQTRRAIEALVLLWHDHLDAAHRIAQALETRDGRFVHAIMHRREPDYWNSKYWWRRVGVHPCFAELARRSSEFLHAEDDSALARQIIPGGQWDAFAFVDACEAAAGHAPNDPLVLRLRQIQRIETETALQHWLRPVLQ